MNDQSSQCQGLGRIGLALSGGGARAMAYHLGCLRALHEAGILETVATISAVSGGSVIAALYCSEPGDFGAFEARVHGVLRHGFVWAAIQVSVTSLEGLRALANTTLVALDRVAAISVALCLHLIPNGIRPNWRWLRESRVRRRATRTTILRRVLMQCWKARGYPICAMIGRSSSSSHVI